MGAQGSKGNKEDDTETNAKHDTEATTKVKLDNISTVTMALDSNGAKSAAGRGKSVGGTVDGNQQMYPMQKYPSSPAPQLNSSSVRFSPLSTRALDINGNHQNSNFYRPNSIGRGSVNSRTTNPNTAEDPNNNTLVYSHSTADSKGTLSKGSKGVDSLPVDKSSHRPTTPTKPNSAHPTASARSGRHFSSVIISKEEPDLDQTDPTKMGQSSRKSSGCTLLVFLLELLSLLGLVAFAYVLHYTDTFHPVDRPIDCADPSINAAHKPAHMDSIYLANTAPNTFYLVFLLAPLGLILLLEIFRQLILIGLAHTVPSESIGQNKLATIAFPIYIRRIVRFTGGFLFGGLMTSILVDILKYQTGALRPYFMHTCVALTALPCPSNMSIVSQLCGADDLKVAQTSFPSMSAAMLVYAVTFVVLYLCFALPYRALRFLRVWMVLALLVLTGLVFNARMSTNQSHLSDMVVGTLIGLFLALFIVFIHLNAFANRLSNSNFFGANRTNRDRAASVEGQTGTGESDLFDEVSHSNLFADSDKDWFWKNFHIPRVHTLRQSARNMWRKSENYFNRPSMVDSVTNTPKSNHKMSNAYINPAFNGGRDDSGSSHNHTGSNILANHLHQESRFGSNARDSIVSGSNNLNGNHNQARSTLRTFQANS